MNPLNSRKLIGSIVSMLAIAGMVLGSIALDVREAITATVSIAGVEGPVLFWAIVICGGLGGFQILKQFQQDSNGDNGNNSQ